MIDLLLIGAACCCAPPADDPVTPDQREAYRAASESAGSDAGAHVRLSLWCEARGMEAERSEQLTLALRSDPDNAAAHGLMGQVARDGRWERPDDVADRARADAALAEYEARRSHAPRTQKAQWELALWCEAHGLKVEATAHLLEVTRIAPEHPRNSGIVGLVHPVMPVDHREAAWKRLGCRKHHGRWMDEREIAAEEADVKAQEKADHAWKPRLERWRRQWENKATREKVEREMLDVTDPLAVPSIVEVFGRGGADQQDRATQLLGQIDAPAASRALAWLAVAGQSEGTRRAATETLKLRDPRGYVGMLIGLVRSPLKYEVRPGRTLASPDELIVEGERSIQRRIYDPRANIASVRGNRKWTGPDGIPIVLQGLYVRGLSRATDPDTYAYWLEEAESQIVRNRAEIIASLAVGRQFADQKVVEDVRSVEEENLRIHAVDSRVLPVLEAVTGRSFGEDKEAWKSWWGDWLGYRYSPARKPTVTRRQGFYGPRLNFPSGLRTSCFAAGTPVHTLTGLRPIESLQIGDVVLSQDTATGALSYQPVVGVHHNPPDAVLRIECGGEAILATGIHRFWLVGKGWVMARELRPGDAIRTLGGLARVVAVGPDEEQPVFNLDVARARDFFVGKRGTLAHDNSVPEPELQPFDLTAADPATALRPVR